jgi:tRNA nucleotidyltransferase (CCA-adding enzyme)
MTGDEYIESVLARHELKPSFFASLAKFAIVPELEKWANGNQNRILYTGSMAKGTGVSGTTDLDIFISLNPTTPHTLEDIYERLFRRSQGSSWSPRRQNVSIGITFLGASIDLVPGKLQDGYVYYHSLWKHKEQTWPLATAR